MRAAVHLNECSAGAASLCAEPFSAVLRKREPRCADQAGVIANAPRELSNGIEGLMYKSNCHGCAYAYVALADSCGFPARAIGCGGHIVAEAFVGDRWRMVDSAGRHPENAGYPIYFESSYMEMVLDPFGDHGGNVPDGFRDGLFDRPNGQFHFHEGMWQAPPTLRFATSNAHAIYPDAKRWGFRTYDGKRLSIDAARREIRRAAFPEPITGEDRRAIISITSSDRVRSCGNRSGSVKWMA